jgi:hypothetical protein
MRLLLDDGREREGDRPHRIAGAGAVPVIALAVAVATVIAAAAASLPPPRVCCHRRCCRSLLPAPSPAIVCTPCCCSVVRLGSMAKRAALQLRHRPSGCNRNTYNRVVRMGDCHRENRYYAILYCQSMGEGDATLYRLRVRLTGRDIVSHDGTETVHGPDKETHNGITSASPSSSI